MDVLVLSICRYFDKKTIHHHTHMQYASYRDIFIALKIFTLPFCCFQENMRRKKRRQLMGMKIIGGMFGV